MNAPKSCIDLRSWMNKQVRIKFVGDLEVVGKLKSFDKLPNLVLDDAIDARTGRELGVVF